MLVRYFRIGVKIYVNLYVCMLLCALMQTRSLIPRILKYYNNILCVCVCGVAKL